MSDGAEAEASTEDEPPLPGGMTAEEACDEITQLLLESGVTFDEDGTAVPCEPDEAYEGVTRGHSEAIGLTLCDAEDAPPEGDGGDATAGGETGEEESAAGSEDGGAEGGDDGAEQPTVDCGSGDPWGAADVTDDPTQDADDVGSGDAPEGPPAT